MLELIECPSDWCDEPAEVLERYVLRTSDGAPVAHHKVQCVLGHRFDMPAND